MDPSRRPKTSGECKHSSPVVVERVEGGGRVARCLACGHVGPVVGAAAEEALRGLRSASAGRERGVTPAW